MRDQIAMDVRMEFTRSASMLAGDLGETSLAARGRVPQALMLKKNGSRTPVGLTSQRKRTDADFVSVDRYKQIKSDRFRDEKGQPGGDGLAPHFMAPA
jgi:hypothetical protein